MKLYDNEYVTAFLDIAPVNLGHALVVPKIHSENMVAASDDDLAKLFPAVKKVAKAVLSATGAGGFNIGVNTGAVAGQIVFHTHIHVIPRFESDGLKRWGKKAVTKEELAAMAEKIRAALG